MSKNQTINYLGRVLDKKKQAPIRGAKVSFNYEGNSVITYTDLEGIYRLTINSNHSEIIQGQLTIEANGYKNYSYLINLLSKQKDLGDIRLIESNSTETEDLIPIPIIVAIFVALFIITIIAIKPLLQRNSGNRQSNIYQRLDISKSFQSVSYLH